ncbi:MULTISPECIES: hypothetical protein [Actinoplanes]|uniref:hypothetical protein n=1 Tax=Actinoplanes TaxID=1865 RepID=UPI000B10D6A6|nr:MULTISPECIES: hypothetical protein [Actinoplanes]GLY02404.1 hypothetical protein Acsp01_27830 [Actinoplanes sp. NBRC 101535]
MVLGHWLVTALVSGDGVLTGSSPLHHLPEPTRHLPEPTRPRIGTAVVTAYLLAMSIFL